MISPTPPHPCRFRTYRDSNGRAVGACCLTCGRILRLKGTADVDDDTLEALALGLLLSEDAGDVTLEPAARRRLQSIRRRLHRAARQAEP